MEYVLSTNALCKSYRHFKALNGLSMHVPKGAIYGFVGKNGAGKTTLIRLICGLQAPTSGDYTLYGLHSNEADIRKARRRMGAVVETPSIYLDMTAEDNLKEQYRILGMPSWEGIPELLELVGLENTGRKKAKNFSLGMRQRLGIAIALAGILLCVIIVLSIKLFFMQKAAWEIETDFAERVLTDTNTLIQVSGGGRCMKRLGASINTQLKLLQKERHRFQEGNLELKEAVTNISHDLRTPLTAICGYLDLLHQEALSEDTSRYIAQIENRTEVLKQLTEELFRYSIVTSTQDSAKETMDLRRPLEETLVSFYGALQQSGIEPHIRLPEAPVIRRLDTAAVNRIFSNIVSNALKYSEGDLDITMENDGTIRFSNTTRQLTPVTVEKLFNRFYTVETGRSSTGLGLSIAKLLTERMGGSIEADYRNMRLCITLRFPH